MLLKQLRGLVYAETAGGLPDAELLERFVAQRDQAAFEVLLWRYGPMVLGVCRRALRQDQDVEDAFQAVFLTLSRRAESIQRGQALAGWLYQVAYRTALAARKRARRTPTPQSDWDDLPARDGCDPAEQALQADVLAKLDAAIHRLPERYRLPLILCRLQGKSCGDAARALGCPEGTIKSRLARATERLRRGLCGRGVLTATALAAICDQASATLPAFPLVARTLRLSVPIPPWAATVAASPAVASLSQGVIRAMLYSRLQRYAAVALCAAAMIAGGLAAYAAANREKPANAASPADSPEWKLKETKFAKGIGKTRLTALAPDQSLIATVDDAQTLTLWSLADEKEHKVLLKGHFDAVNAIAFSPDGKLFAAGMGEYALVWNIEKGNVVKKLQLPTSNAIQLLPGGDAVLHRENEVIGVGFAADSKTVFAGVRFPTVFFGDLESKRKELFELMDSADFGRLYIEAGPFHVTLVTPSADRKRLIVGGENPDIVRQRGNVATLTLIELGANDGGGLSLSSHESGYASAQFAPDGKRAAAGTLDGQVHLFSGAKLDVSKTLEGHKAAVTALAFDAEGKRLASVDKNGLILLWDPEKAKEVGRLEGSKSAVAQLAFAKDGKRLVVAYGNGSVQVFETK